MIKFLDTIFLVNREIFFYRLKSKSIQDMDPKFPKFVKII